LLAPTGADALLADDLATSLEKLAQEGGMRFELRQTLAPEEITADVAVIVAMAPDLGLASLAATAPQTQFVGIDLPDLQPATNISVIGDGDALLAQQAFLAGYLAAVVSEDWRVAMVAPAGADGEVAREAFRNGVVFFCGLCRPAAPPFVEYPLEAEFSANEQQAFVDNLKGQFIEIAYIAPGINDPALLESLANAGIKLVGNQSPPASVQPHWLATVRSDPAASLAVLWSDLIAGIGGAIATPGLQVTERNPELFSTGRQRLVDETLLDLTAGYIDPGVSGVP
jgi:hypothetical protein